MKMKKLFAKRKHRWAITDRLFLSLFLTGTIIEFSQVGAGFVDGLIISRLLGPVAMAAEGLIHPIYSILGVVSGLLAIGMQVKCAQVIGRGNRKEFIDFFSITIYVGAAVSLAVLVAILVFARQIAVLLGASGNAADLADDATRYLVGVGIGIPPLIMTAIIAPALQLDNGSRNIQVGALIETVSNILMDIIAVKTGMGIFGVGLATAVASYLNLLYQCTFFLKKDRTLHLAKPDVTVRQFFQMLGNGSEKAIKRLGNSIRPIILNAVIISYGGSMAMSLLSIRNNFSNFAEIFGAGIASAVSLLCGVYYGEINEEAIEEVLSYKNKMALLFSGSICILILVFAEPLAHLYITENQEILQMAIFVFRMLALQIPLQTLITSRIKYLQAIYRKLNMELLILATSLVFVLLSALVMGRMFGVYGILSCYTLSDLLTCISIYVFYAIKHVRLFPTKKNFINLPEYFYLNPGDEISLDIRNEEEVSLASEQIMLFCKGHKIDQKISYYAALAFEELALNIVEFGFPKSKVSNPIIDLRVVITENAFVLRIRDNCPHFDVTAKIAEVREEKNNQTENLGIRIVSRIASDITYLNTFDINNLIIKFNLENNK